MDTAHDCCVAAITDPNQAILFAYQLSTATCFIAVTADGCPDSASNAYTGLYDDGAPVILGDAYCGPINTAAEG